MNKSTKRTRKSNPTKMSISSPINSSPNYAPFNLETEPTNKKRDYQYIQYDSSPSISLRKHKNTYKKMRRNSSKSVYSIKSSSSHSSKPDTESDAHSVYSIDSSSSYGLSKLNIKSKSSKNMKPSVFPITDENIYEFKRFIKKPMDCVINALQIIKIVDEYTANIMRICVGDYVGLNANQIQDILTLHNKKRYIFTEYLTNDKFAMAVNEDLPNGHVLFATGKMQGMNFGHAFIIGKTLDNKFLYIDPQIEEHDLANNSGIFCDLSHEKCNDMFSKYSDLQILCNYDVPLSKNDLVDLELVSSISI